MAELLFVLSVISTKIKELSSRDKKVEVKNSLVTTHWIE